MTIPRFFIEPQLVDEPNNSITCQDAKLIKQVLKVLRLENGAKIDFLDGKGNIYHCILQNFAFSSKLPIARSKN